MIHSYYAKKFAVPIHPSILPALHQCRTDATCTFPFFKRSFCKGDIQPTELIEVQLNSDINYHSKSAVTCVRDQLQSSSRCSCVIYLNLFFFHTSNVILKLHYIFHSTIVVLVAGPIHMM